MKSILLRALASILLGGLLMAYPEKVTVWLVIVSGVLFLVPGLFSLFTYFKLRKEDNSFYAYLPIAGAASTLLGIWMILDSGFFVTAFMFSIAVLLILVAVQRIVGNFRAGKYIHVPFYFYVFPVLLMVVAGFVLANPIQAAGLPIYILGTSMIVYGLLELWISIWLNQKIKQMKKVENVDVVDAEVVE